MMVIGKINTVFMKHSRILFGAISVVIIVSFLGFLTPGFPSMFGGGARSEEHRLAEWCVGTCCCREGRYD